jgi:sialate O-acetylesterase
MQGLGMMVRKLVCAWLLVVTGLAVSAMKVSAEVKVTGIFSSHMVLQRDMPVPVWGTAAPGEKVAVNFRSQVKSAVADANGKWLVKLDKLEVGGPDVMKIAAANTITLEDVLVGEVWLGSGQSNMDLPVSQANVLNTAIDCLGDPVLAGLSARSYPKLRLFINGNRWEEATPTNNLKFSALLFAFGVPLQKDLNVPVGLMKSAQGATSSRCWLSQDAFDSDPACKEAVLKLMENQGDKLLPQQKWGAIKVGDLYEGRIRSMIPYAIRGVLWDQGEAGTDMAGVDQYTLMGALIRGWRKDWAQGDFPFLYIQKPSGPGCAWDYDDPVTRLARPFAPLPNGVPGDGGNNDNYIRIMRHPNTAMVTSSDLGTKNHPDNKSGYGARAARVALGFAYGRKVEYYGPRYQSHKLEGGKVRVSFDHIGKGLAWCNGAKLQGFAIAGEDRAFQWADAVIDGQTVVLSCDQVKNPVAASYGWGDTYPWANLFNKDQLPALPFRTE